MLLALALVACKSATPAPRDVSVAPVKGATPAVEESKPACGPDHEIGTLDVEAAMGLAVTAICIRGAGDDTQDVGVFLKLKVGTTLDEERLEADVRNLFESGFFRRVDVLARAQDGGVELTYELEARPKIASVQFHGEQPTPNDPIRKLVGKPYSPAMLAHEIDTLESREDVTVESLVMSGFRTVNIVLDLKKR